MKIKIKGTIIPNSYKDIYDELCIEATCPADISLPEDGEEMVSVEINSPGGDVMSGSEIYTALKKYPGKVYIEVVGIAASMASVIAMAGDHVAISPTAQMMIHNVSSVAWGDKLEMEHEAEVLSGFDQTIANAYRLKTKLEEAKLLDMMSHETWLTPQEALKLGFADEILFDQEQPLLVASAKTAVFLSPKTIQMVRAKLIEREDAMKNLRNEIEEEQEQEEVEETEETEERTEEESTEEEETEGEEEHDESDSHEGNGGGALIHCEAISSGKLRERTGARLPNFQNEVENVTLITVGGKQGMSKVTYREAFLNHLQGRQNTRVASEVFDQENLRVNESFTHDTTNTSIVIPRETQDKIWMRAVEGYGVLEDVVRLHVKGELRLIRHTGIESGDANWYLENVSVADEKNTFDDIVLKGHELAKAVTISWKLKKMAIDDFENFLVRELGQRIAVALGKAVTKGTGTNQMTGILTALDKNKRQIVHVAQTGKIAYADLLSGIAKVAPAYKRGAKIYANSSVIWTKLANVVDTMGRPFFIPDNANGGVGNVLGFVVKEDAGLSDNEVLIGNVLEGYLFNVNEEMSLTIEDHAKARTTDYVAYSIVDGAVKDDQAFAVLNLTQGL